VRRLAPLVIAFIMAGCGDGKDAPGANGAQPQASAQILDQNQAAENVVQAVPRETMAEHPAPSPNPAPPAKDRYRAIGTEPFWAVTIKGSTATLERPDKPPARYAVSRHDDRRTIRYLGDGFTMTLTEGPCSDGMSDAVWSDRVALAFGEGTLSGCGGERDDQGQDRP
jgi:uncharacterized membrane protein